MQDKRKNRRFMVKRSCWLKVEGREQPLSVTLVNVSLGGFGVTAGEEIPLGTRVVLDSKDLPFPAAAGVVLACKVCNLYRSRLRPGEVRIGFTFEGTAPEVIQRLLQWAQTQLLIERRSEERLRKIRATTRPLVWE